MMFSFVAMRILSVPVWSSRVTPCPSASAFGGLSSFPGSVQITAPMGSRCPLPKLLSAAWSSPFSSCVHPAIGVLTNHSERTALGAVGDLGPLSLANRGDTGIEAIKASPRSPRSADPEPDGEREVLSRRPDRLGAPLGSDLHPDPMHARPRAPQHPA